LIGDGDILVLIGKGAEDFQKIGKERIYYSDIECVKDYMC
jgi:UDP-N-acetylmuramyl tripeptide synthase